MVAIFAVLISVILFIFVFSIKLISDIFFIFRKKNKVEVVEKFNRKPVIKNRKRIVLTKKKLKFQSVIFYAKFLQEKQYLRLPVLVKLLVNDYYAKLINNTRYMTSYVDFDRLNNAGIFNRLPILKIKIKSIKGLESITGAMKIVFGYVKFRAIFLIEESGDNELVRNFLEDKAIGFDYKLIFLKDINLKLLQEINKLDLNFKPDFEGKEVDDFNFNGIKFEITKRNTTNGEFFFEDKNRNIRITKFLNFTDNDFNNSGVSYYLNFFNKSNKNSSIKFSFNYRLKNEFFNIKTENKSLKIEYFNHNFKDDIFVFTKEANNYKIIKIKGIIYININFNVNISKGFFAFIYKPIRDFDITNRSDVIKLILENNLKINKLFNFKIFIKNNEFNNFFNKELFNQIIYEKLNENKLLKNNLSSKILLKISKLFKLNYKDLAKFDYFSLYNFITKEVFGISFKDKFLSIQPNKKYYNQNFKVIHKDNKGENHSIYVDQNSEFKGFEIGNVIYSNLNLIDVNLLNENIKLSV